MQASVPEQARFDTTGHVWDGHDPHRPVYQRVPRLTNDRRKARSASGPQGLNALHSWMSSIADMTPYSETFTTSRITPQNQWIVDTGLLAAAKARKGLVTIKE